MKDSANRNDIPIPLAIGAFGAVILAYYYFTFLRFHPGEVKTLLVLGERYSGFIWVSICAVAVNLTLLGIYLKRQLGLEKQGSRLAALEGRKDGVKFGRLELVACLIGVSSYFIVSALVTDALGNYKGLFLRFVGIATVLVSVNLALVTTLVCRLLLQIIGKISVFGNESQRLDAPEIESGDLILGTTTGELGKDGHNE